MKYKSEDERIQELTKYAKEHVFKNFIVECDKVVIGDSPVWSVWFHHPDSSNCSIRYLFFKNHVTVTGDLGDYVLELSCDAKPVMGFWKQSIGYLYSKITSFYRGEKEEYDADICVNVIRETAADYEEDYTEEQKETLEELISAANSVNSYEGWLCEINNIDYDSLFTDVWEWIYDAGSVTPTWVIYVLTGLRLVSERLENAAGYPNLAPGVHLKLGNS